MWHYLDIRQLPDIPRHWARRRPEHVALVEGSRTRTYAELDRRSNAIAAKLPRGAPIGFVGKNCLEFFELWFAAMKVGAPLVPFNFRSPAAEMTSVVADSGATLVFATPEFAPLMREVQAKTPFELLESLEAEDAPDPAAPLSGLSPALLSYTSGTTGQPKGALYRQEAFEHWFMLSSLEPSLAWREDDVMLMAMPNFHLGGSWMCIGALYAGATLSIVPNFDTDLVLEAVPRDRVTILPLVPTAIQLLLDSPRFSAVKFESVRAVQYFGSPISVSLLKRATELLRAELVQLYGATEMWIATMLRPEHIVEKESRITSCGKPLPFVSLKIVDRERREVPDGVVGEVLVRTPTRFSGYLGQPETTARVLDDEGWYATGDLGRRDEDGFYYLVDRAKDMVITGGENVYSVEVEAALASHPAVAQVAVIGVPDAKWGERVTAYVVLRPAMTASEAELQAHCHARIAKYKAPKSVRFESALPMTPNGKIQKSVLRERSRNA